MSEQKLHRELGLKEATALNMIDMVGIGPFLVIPFVIEAMQGPHAILAWVAGALLAFFDAFIWAELGAAMPQAGGTYVFLRETYGGRAGKFMSFLFIWQTIIQAPLVVASGAVGFAQYSTYFYPEMTALQQTAISATLVIILTATLYRRITSIGKLSVFLWVCVLTAILWLIFGGMTHFNAARAFDYPAGAFDMSWVFAAGLGAATVQTVYTYLGYYNVCHLGAEIREPEKIIPKSIFISVAGIAVLYLSMQLGILGVIPWQEIAGSKFIVSTFVERLYGETAAGIATILILLIAFSSLFAVILGYSRIPFAAAQDGTFFSIFGKLHPTKNFPYISLLVLGGIALFIVIAFGRLTDIIKSILAMRILVQFIGQAVGLMVLKRRVGKDFFPFKMPLYPLPIIISILAWIGLFFATGEYMRLSLYFLAAGIVVYFVREKLFKRELPKTHQ
jgi:amino acid transporter